MIKINYQRNNKTYLSKNPDVDINIDKEELLLGLLLSYPDNIFKIDDRLFGCDDTYLAFQAIKDVDTSSVAGLLLGIQTEHPDMFQYCSDLWNLYNLEHPKFIDATIIALEGLRVNRLKTMCASLTLQNRDSVSRLKITEFSDRELLPKFDFEYQSTSDVLDVVLDDIENSESMKGLDVGIKILDEILGGIASDDTITIAARPSMGKTTLSIQLLATLSEKNNIGILLNTLEVPRKRLMTKFLSYFSGIPERNIRYNIDNCIKTPEFLAAIDRLRCLDIEIVEYKYTPNQLRSAVMLSNARRKAVGKNPISFVWQDYLQLKDAETYMHDERARINFVLAEEIKMQKELGFVLINLSQISRNAESRGGTKRPMMADLAESGKIEMTSRKIIMLYRPEVYGILEDENGESLKDTLEMIVVKNNNGKTGVGTFKNINMSCNKIYNPETPDEDIDAFNSDLQNNNFSFPRVEPTEDMPF